MKEIKLEVLRVNLLGIQFCCNLSPDEMKDRKEEAENMLPNRRESEESLSERKREGETSVKVYHSTRD